MQKGDSIKRPFLILAQGLIVSMVKLENNRINGNEVGSLTVFL